MARRRPKTLSDVAPILGRLKQGREAAIDVCRQIEINGPIYKAAGGVLKAIDALALALTGRGDVFHDPFTVFRCRRCHDMGWLCEEHPTSPHPHLQDGCDAAGEPCPDCNGASPPRLPKGWTSLARVDDPEH